MNSRASPSICRPPRSPGPACLPLGGLPAQEKARRQKRRKSKYEESSKIF